MGVARAIAALNKGAGPGQEPQDDRSNMAGVMEEKAAERHHGQSERLHQASALYKEGRFFEALTLLDELGRERPDSRHVLFSQGMCLAAIGHTDDARRALVRLHEIQGRTAASLAHKLQERLDAIDSRRHRPEQRRSIVNTLLGQVLRPKGLLAGAAVLVITIAAVAIFGGESDGAPRTVSRPSVLTATPAGPRTHAASHVNVSTFYLAGQQDPVRYAIVSCPYPDTGACLFTLEDQAAGRVVANWPELRNNVEEALVMAAQTGDTLDDLAPHEVARIAVIPREGMALAGGLRGRNVDRFVPGSAKTLRELALAAGSPEDINLWPQGTALTGIEGDVCWWGRFGVATDDKGVITHVVIIGLSLQDAPPAENTNPEAGTGA